MPRGNENMTIAQEIIAVKRKSAGGPVSLLVGTELVLN